MDSNVVSGRDDVLNSNDLSSLENDSNNMNEHNLTNNAVLYAHSDVLLDTTSDSEKHDEAWQERESRNALKRCASRSVV